MKRHEKRKGDLEGGARHNSGQTPLGNGFPALGFVAAQGWEKRKPSTQVLREKSEILNLVVYLKSVSMVSKSN